MDEAGIEKAVIPGRQSPGTFVDNQELCDLAKQWPGRFIAFPLYDPLRPKESLEEVRRILMDGPGRQVSPLNPVSAIPCGLMTRDISRSTAGWRITASR